MTRITLLLLSGLAWLGSIGCTKSPAGPTEAPVPAATNVSLVTTFRGAVVDTTPVVIPSPEALVVEVESVLALVHAARAPVAHLMLFDELFRGTNAVERIAAAEAVLVALLAGRDAAPAPHVVVAATHDQELVDLLQGLYVAYHFTDSIDADGLAFDYRLLPGPATTRNAIALLAQRGAPPELVSHALERAQRLDDARRSAAPHAGPMHSGSGAV